MPEENKNENVGNENSNNDENTKETQYKSFEEFLSSADESVKGLYEQHTSGLKSALQKERDDRKQLSEKVRELSEKAGADSELATKLKEAQDLLDKAEQRSLEAEKKANFIEMAIKPEIGCTNAKAAYAIAINENLFDSKGNPDWKSLKATAPELFKTSKITNAGNQQKTTAFDMNEVLRSAAGINK